MYNTCLNDFETTNISILWPLVWLTSNLGADMANPYTGPSLICFGWLLLIVDRH